MSYSAKDGMIREDMKESVSAKDFNRILNEMPDDKRGSKMCGCCGATLNVTEVNSGSMWCEEWNCHKCTKLWSEKRGLEDASALLTIYRRIGNLGNVAKYSTTCLSVIENNELNELAAVVKKRSRCWIKQVLTENAQRPTFRKSRVDQSFLLLDDARILRLFPKSDLVDARKFVKDTDQGRGFYEALETIELRIHRRGEEKVEDAMVSTNSSLFDAPSSVPKDSISTEIEAISTEEERIQSIIEEDLSIRNKYLHTTQVDEQGNACAVACILRPLYFDFQTMHAVARSSRSATNLFQNQVSWRMIVMEKYPEAKLSNSQSRRAIEWRTLFHLERLKEAKISTPPSHDKEENESYRQPISKLCSQRLMREAHEMMTRAPEGISACPCKAEDITMWKATILGPPQSPYEGGIFRLELKFSANYPIVAPRVKFLTKIFHPNIDHDTGVVCCDLLEPNAWSAAASIRVLLLSIQSLLTSPTADDSNSPANAQAAHLFHTDYDEFLDIVANYVEHTKVKEGNFSILPDQCQTPSTKKVPPNSTNSSANKKKKKTTTPEGTSSSTKKKSKRQETSFDSNATPKQINLSPSRTNNPPDTTIPMMTQTSNRRASPHVHQRQELSISPASTNGSIYPPPRTTTDRHHRSSPRIL
mmetsp:Transcript_20694/g.26784  ORF Transcript_20694/g.26784 Transcript_20694/m.26784 type:complete len:645 (-) Transcript_20694:664-2598(-)|eukprot:CAMPEP_0197289628 /NCGR_PEP_ID=MMETSP0890-20130614/6881_1 /TAXON_ID=44058 ORGANISM="Aureoumbra lagunensis, Strain CCMP1510" /NCGR_SAMPLE_ID=MMETSP0890 /ASSEMBLY_ACC=CAM_ASM_000533 /LENGTH=644 /DNA_ID=CAMNT_0042761145 /DNA_START=82 /DNA_END=2016 /DNA_ORIENTATION=-